MTDPIVTLNIIAVFAAAREVPIRAEIGRAEPDPQGGAACAVELTPVYQDPVRVRGVDSFHATWLACSLVLKLLGHLKDEGARLSHQDGSEFPLEAYLAGLDARPGDAAGR